MVAFNYLRSRDTADRLIKNFGQLGKLRREAPGAGPGFNPGAPTVTLTDAMFAVVAFSQNEIDGTRIRAEDKRIILSASGWTAQGEVSGDLPEPKATAHQLVEA